MFVWGSTSATPADAFRTQLLRTTNALTATTAEQERLSVENATLRREIALLRAVGIEGSSSTEESGPGSSPTPPTPASTPNISAPTSTHTQTTHQQNILHLLAAVTPPAAAYARSSPSSDAGVHAGEARARALAEWLEAAARTSREAEDASTAYATASDALAACISGLGHARWSGGAAQGAVGAAAALAARALGDAAAAARCGAAGVAAAFGALEAELLPAATRARVAAKASAAASDDADAAAQRLLTTRRGASARDVLARSAEAASAASRADLVRFDSAAAGAALEARRRIVTIDRLGAAIRATARASRNGADALSVASDAFAPLAAAAAAGRSRLTPRDAAWRKVRDSLETDLVRGAAPSAVDEEEWGDDVSVIAPAALIPTATRLLMQATAPLDRVEEASRRAAVAVALRVLPLDATAEDVEDSDSAPTPTPRPSLTLTTSYTPSVATAAQYGLISHANSPTSSSLTSPQRGAVDRWSSPDIVRAGWLFLNTRVGGGAALAQHGLGGAGAALTAPRWAKRWLYIREEGVRGLRLYLVVPKGARLIGEGGPGGGGPRGGGRKLKP